MDATWVAVITPLVTFSLSIIGSVGFAVYAVFRLNSPQIIREKIWNAFIGDKDFNDETLKSFSQHQLDLARFRVVYGIPAQSVSDLHRLLSWMAHHRFTPADVKRARRWIDPSQDDPLTAPSKLRLTARLVVAAMMIAAFMMILDKATNSRTTMISMRISKTWMWSDGTSVEGIWGQPWRIDAQSCGRPPLADTSITGLTDAETTAICRGIPNGDLQTTVNEGLRYQRWSLAVISFFLFLAGIKTGLTLCFGMRARELTQRLSPTILSQADPRRARKKRVRANSRRGVA
ncbi:DUF6216 family protein [Burkholderia cenocepacia]|uniref:DUF6216 family protein n=1 Tax=Burkholderia cenocepacia TaxID=95486 RepID=UPI0028545348|nr:DUF6216 family protein [Burkholderia cenocepacia]MDR8071038.1 hypothetical protein [Burkholderia cenocepacia]